MAPAAGNVDCTNQSCTAHHYTSSPGPPHAHRLCSFLFFADLFPRSPLDSPGCPKYLCLRFPVVRQM